MMKKNKKIIVIFAVALLCIISLQAKNPIKILAIGNSFTQDAVRNNLYDIAKADGVDVIIGAPYKGGTTLEMHCNYIDKDTASYRYRKIVNGKFTSQSNTTMKYAIQDEKWDYVIIQTDHNYSGVYDHYFPYLTKIMDYVKKNVQQPDSIRFGLYMTWAYDKNSNYKDFPLYDCNQDVMYNKIVDCATRAAKQAGIDLFIPGGTTIQNARTSSIGDSFTCDGYHMNRDYGRYAIGCTWYESITGRSVIGNQYIPNGLSPYKASICQYAAHLAVRKPTEVTSMSLWNSDPIDEFYKGDKPKKLNVGTTISVFKGINGLTYDNFRKAKNAGLECIEISLTNLVNGDNPIPNDQLKERFRKVKADADRAGIRINSIHMPYAFDCDPSHVDEKIRKKSVKAYRSYLDVVSVLHPQYILFHPSWRLGLNERPQRIKQLLKSIKELNKDVKKMNANIILENLLGYKLLRSKNVESALCRTVEEMTYIMSLMPSDVYAIVDLNHIAHPELLLEALGSRVKSLHVCDGNGIKDRHALPGRAENNWNVILDTLYKIGYTGPFLYEIKGDQVESFPELIQNYNNLYNNYLEYRRSQIEKATPVVINQN